jgi:hypothetical protein
MRTVVVVSITCVLAVITPSRVNAQTPGFTAWVMTRLATAVAAEAGSAPDGKQVEAPSIANDSTALVDSGGAPDLLGIATQLFNVGTAAQGTPMSITVSAFGLRTALRGEDPMRPTVYASGRNWRRISVTLGRQTQGDDGEPDEAQLIGAKFLLYDRRDPTHPDNILALQSRLTKSDTSILAANEYQALFELLFRLLKGRVGATNPVSLAAEDLSERLDATVALLTIQDLAEVDEFLREQLAPALAAIGDEQREIVKSLRQSPQIAFAYQSKLRKDSGDDEHAWQAIANYGVASRFSIAANAALLLINSSVLPNETSWKVSAEGTVQLTRGPATLAELERNKRPLTLSGSFAAARDDGRSSTRKGQVKLTVPIALGMSLPISVTVANRVELIDEAEVRGHVGFTLDFSALQRTLRSAVR